jgi:hypothetical protein
MADRTITITWSPRTTHHFNRLSSATHRGGLRFKITGAIRLPSGDLRQSDQSGRRTRRDLPGEAVGQLGRHKTVTRHADGEPFGRSFVQNDSPRGFQKVRYYGWMSPNCKLQLAKVRWLVWLWRGWTCWLGNAMFQPALRKPPVLKCQHCGDEFWLVCQRRSTYGV